MQTKSLEKLSQEVMQSGLLIPESLLDVAKYVYCNFLSKPFKRKDYLTPNHQFKRDPNVLFLTLSDGEKVEVPRPNHGIAHTLRVVAFVPLVIAFLKKQGNHTIPFINTINYLTERDICNLQVAALFSVVGRLDETGFSKENNEVSEKTKKRYRQYRQSSAEALRSYCSKGLMTKDELEFWSSVVLEMGNLPFYLNDHNSLMAQASVFAIPNRAPHVVDICLHLAHCMDLFRCHDFTKSNPLEMLKWYSQTSNVDFEKDYLELMQFAENALLATDNKIKTRIDAEGKAVWANALHKHYREKFYQCNTNVEFAVNAIQSVSLPSFCTTQQLPIPIEIPVDNSLIPYLNQAIQFNSQDNKGFFLAFPSEKMAILCLDGIKKTLSASNATIKSAKVSKYTYKETATPWRFRVLLNQWEAIRTNLRANACSLKPKNSFYIKSIRADALNFYHSFTSELVDTNIRLEKRKGPKKTVNVNGKGISIKNKMLASAKYPLKQSQYAADEKKEYTKFQSTSLAFENYNPPVFGFNKRDILIGFIFEEQHVKLSEYLMIYDGGTANRPFYFFNEAEAENYAKNRIGKTLFSKNDISSFKKTLLDTKNEKKYNEVLARLQWACDETGKIFIYTDTLESRLLAKQYAISFENRLKQAGRCADDYQIPIVFYSPETPELLFKQYSQVEYELDCLEVRTIKNSAAELQAKYDKNNYEVLLGLPQDTIQELLLKDKINTLPLPLHLLNQGYVHLFRFLREKSGYSLQTILEPVLEALNNNPNLVYSILYYALLNEDHDLLDFIQQTINVKNFKQKQNVNDNSPLIAAIDKNNTKWVRILSSCSWINSDSKHQPTNFHALGLALYYDRLEATQVLINAGWGENKNLLHFVVSCSSYKLIQMLLENNADIHLVWDNKTPYQLAHTLGRFDVLHLMLNGHDGIPKEELTSLQTLTLVHYNTLCLFASIKENNLNLVKHYLAKEVDLSIQNKDKKTPIELAIELGRFNIVRFIANTYTDTQRQNTVLHTAIKNNQIEMVQLLLKVAVDLSIQNKDKKTPIELAAELGHFDIVTLIAKSKKTNEEDTFHYGSALVYAVEKKQYDCVIALLGAGANRTWQRTATENGILHLAVINNDLKMIDFLLNYNVDSPLASKNKDGKTPTALAAELGHFDIVTRIAKSKKTNEEDTFHYGSALLNAVEKKQYGCVIALFEAGASITWVKTATSNGILHLAAINKDLGMFSLLLNYKVDNLLASKNNDGKTPIALAAELGYFDIVTRIAKSKKTNEEDVFHYGSALLNAVEKKQHDCVVALLEAGANTTWHRTATGNGILHFAVINNDLKMIDLLLNYNVDSRLASKNKDGKTPIALAAELEHFDIVQKIVDSRGTSVLMNVQEKLKSRAMAIIDEEIIRLEASNQQNNLLIGRIDSDFKIELFNQLKHIIENNTPNLVEEIALWEAKNKSALSFQRNLRLFHTPLTKTEEAIIKIKNVLGLSEECLSNALNNALHQDGELKEEEGFVLL